MSQGRKTKADIDSTLKKISEGIDEFDSIWTRVYESETQAQKEKFEGDLKRQIKKLQRLRDKLKPWLQSSDAIIVQYSSQISDAKKKIETKMEQFRECEKETKTKAFSKEGLRQPSKQNPHDEKREDVISRVKKSISDLQKEIEDCEVEERREKLKKKNSNSSLIEKLETYIKNHHWHISKLEFILRQLDNQIIDPYDIEGILDAVDDYVSNYRSKDFFNDESIYDELDMDTEDEFNEELEDISDNEISSTTNSSAPSVSSQPPNPSSPISSSLTQSTVTQPMSPSSSLPLPSSPMSSSLPLPSSPASSSQPFSPLRSSSSFSAKPIPTPSKPMSSINYAQVVQRAKVDAQKQQQQQQQQQQQPTIISSPVSRLSLQPRSSDTKKPTLPQQPTFTEPSFIPPSYSPVDQQFNCIELLNFVSDSYTDFTSHSTIHTEQLSFPTNPVSVPSCFPQTPLQEIVDENVIRKMDNNTLLFAYVYGVSDSQRVLIAKVLTERGWLFNKELKTWVFEKNGEYSVYDYSKWTTRIDTSIKPTQLEKPPVIV